MLSHEYINSTITELFEDFFIIDQLHIQDLYIFISNQTRSINTKKSELRFLPWNSAFFNACAIKPEFLIGK